MTAKKRKPLYIRAYARAWEKVIMKIFTISFCSFFFAQLKQHVVLWKTTRHFMKNHTSFYVKPHVGFWKQVLICDDWVNVLFMLDMCEAIAVGEWIIAKLVVWGVKIRICTCWLSLRTIIQSFLLWNQNFWCIFADRKIATSQTMSIMPCIIGVSSLAMLKDNNQENNNIQPKIIICRSLT